MAQFEIKPSNGKKRVDELERCCNLLEGYVRQTASVADALNQLGAGTQGVKRAIQEIANGMENEQKKIRVLSAKYAEILVVYETTEKNICGFADKNGITIKILNTGSAGGNGGGEDDAWDYILDALKQAFLGDFVDESNLLGTTFSVLIGLIPYVGQAADIRDLVADIYNLIDDGPTVEEWVALGFSVVGILPLAGDFLKHGDEVGNAVKGILKNADKADEIGDAVKNFFKKGDDVVSAIGDQIDDFNQFFKGKFMDKVDDIFDHVPTAEKMKQKMDAVVNAVKGSDVYKNVDQFLNQMSENNVVKKAGEIIQGVVDSYIEDFEKSLISDLIEDVFPGTQTETAVEGNG